MIRLLDEKGYIYPLQFKDGRNHPEGNSTILSVRFSVEKSFVFRYVRLVEDVRN